MVRPPRTCATLTRKWLADTIALADPLTLQVLRPYDPAEAMTAKDAATAAGVTEGAIRGWCERYAIGRLRVGKLMVSRAALAMLLDDDLPALVAYLAGERGGAVAPYFVRARVG